MHFSYPFYLFQQGLDEHSQVETTLHVLFRRVLVEIINADSIHLMNDDRLQSLQGASLDELREDF